MEWEAFGKHCTTVYESATPPGEKRVQLLFTASLDAQFRNLHLTKDLEKKPRRVKREK